MYFFLRMEGVCRVFFFKDGGRVEYDSCNNSPHVQCMRALAATRGRFLLYLFSSSSHMIEPKHRCWWKLQLQPAHIFVLFQFGGKDMYVWTNTKLKASLSKKIQRLNKSYQIRLETDVESSRVCTDVWSPSAEDWLGHLDETLILL